jgi:hypothetical protein
MDQILPPKLNDLELEALREIAVHPASHHVPLRVQSRLRDIGYAKEVLGEIVVTDDGLEDTQAPVPACFDPSGLV